MKNIVLEVGVNHGQDTLRLHQTHKAEVHGFEPVIDLMPKLRGLFAAYPNIHIHNCAVDINDGEATYNIQDRKVGGFGCSSLFKFSEDIHETWAARKDFNFSDAEKVKTTRLDTFLDTLEFDKISYLHCDAQGSDMNVLRSVGKYVDRLQAGQVEVAYTTELYSGTDNRHDVAVAWLQERGFETKVSPHKCSHEADVFFWRA